MEGCPVMQAFAEFTELFSIHCCMGRRRHLRIVPTMCYSSVTVGGSGNKGSDDFNHLGFHHQKKQPKYHL